MASAKHAARVRYRARLSSLNWMSVFHPCPMRSSSNGDFSTGKGSCHEEMMDFVSDLQKICIGGRDSAIYPQMEGKSGKRESEKRKQEWQMADGKWQN